MTGKETKQSDTGRELPSLEMVLHGAVENGRLLRQLFIGCIDMLLAGADILNPLCINILIWQKGRLLEALGELIDEDSPRASGDPKPDAITEVMVLLNEAQIGLVSGLLVELQKRVKNPQREVAVPAA